MKLKFLISLVLVITSFIACEDLPPNAYLPDTFVEGYLITDEPITGIIIMRSQPVSDSFDYDKSLIRNADVSVVELSGDNGGQSFRLVFSEDEMGYHLPDTSYKVKPDTKYRLEINLPDGDFITAETTTPDRISWVTAPKDTIYYPIDTLRLPEVDSLRLSWQPAKNIIFHLIRIKCMDTLNYGIYLNPPTDELNRRISRPYGRNSRYYNDPARWAGPLPNSESPVVWNGLKWYGLHELTIYAPDFNFLRWFIHLQRRGQYEPLLSSTNGAMGVFGSASTVKKTSFIIKNQP